MGLIKEPQNVDFAVLDKSWTVAERKEFSDFIKKRKDQRKKQLAKKNVRKKTVS